jgi:hypothetical protein
MRSARQLSAGPFLPVQAVSIETDRDHIENVAFYTVTESLNMDCVTYCQALFNEDHQWEFALFLHKFGS